MYTNLKYCNKTPNLELKNGIFENDNNSFFQTTLFHYITEEQEIFDYFDNLFDNKKYIPIKNDMMKFYLENLLLIIKICFIQFKRIKKA